MIDVSWDGVAIARERIAPYVHRTPVHTCTAIDRMIDAHVFFKCENVQRTGSFKFRGACNAIAALPPGQRRRGVLTHSSGNHAQALALAARLHGIPAHIVMPEDAPEIKRRATAGYGGRITLCPPTHRGRVETAERIAKETGARFVSAHDDPQVIEGQGTALWELVEEAGDLDLVLVPVGGGGLLSGTLIAASQLLPRAKVIGCEPAGADDAYRGLQAGRRIVDFVPATIADGLRTPLGANTFEIIRQRVDRIALVEEAEIVEAMRLVWERMKILIEPSSAVALAPLVSGKVVADGKRVGIILSGGNVNLSRFFGALEDRLRSRA